MPKALSQPLETRLEQALLRALSESASTLSPSEAGRLASRAASLAASQLFPAGKKSSLSRLKIQAPQMLDTQEKRAWERELQKALKGSPPKGGHELVFEDVFTELYAPETDFAFLLVYEPCLKYLARQDKLLSLDQAVPGARASFHDLGLRRAQEGGALYGLPLFLSTRALFYRADLLKKHGLKPPKTFQEMEEQAAFILAREKEPQLRGLNLDAAPLNRFNLVLDLIWAQGLELFEGNGPWRFAAPAWRTAFRRLQGWFSSKLAGPEALIADSQASAADFLSGGSLFCLHWTDLMRRIHALSRNEAARFGWAPHPTEEKGQRLKTRLGGPTLVVPKSSRHGANGLKLARALLSPESQERLYAKGGWPFPAQTALWGKAALRQSNPWLGQAAEFLESGSLLEERSFFKSHYLNWQSAVNAELSGLGKALPLDEILDRLEPSLSSFLPSRATRGFVAQAQALIESKSAGPLDVAGLAGELKVSREHFIREFKKQCGVTPLKYVQKKQMEKAKEILQTTHYHVGEVARMLGYEDLGHFAKLFKQIVRKNPSAFKRGGF